MYIYTHTSIYYFNRWAIFLKRTPVKDFSKNPPFCNIRQSPEPIHRSGVQLSEGLASLGIKGTVLKTPPYKSSNIIAVQYRGGLRGGPNWSLLYQEVRADVIFPSPAIRQKRQYFHYPQLEAKPSDRRNSSWDKCISIQKLYKSYICECFESIYRRFQLTANYVVSKFVRFASQFIIFIISTAEYSLGLLVLISKVRETKQNI